MRLCPPVSVAGRTAMRDIEVDGYRAEAGSMVLVGIYAMQRDPALWEDPLVFDPDRFSPQNMKSLDRWQYIPFGGGPRSCIGDHFAMLEATIALGTIIRTIDIHSLAGRLPARGAIHHGRGGADPGQGARPDLTRRAGHFPAEGLPAI